MKEFMARHCFHLRNVTFKFSEKNKKELISMYLFLQSRSIYGFSRESTRATQNWFQTAISNQYGPGQMNQYNSQPMYAQQQTHLPQQYQPDGIADAARPPSSTSLRRNSRVLSPQDRPGVINQSLNDRFKSLPCIFYLLCRRYTWDFF